jgi:hypothetical protein
VALGLLQMAGDLAHLPALKGVGAASGASPAPKVFSTVRGLETYSTGFALEWIDPTGAVRSLSLTRDVYVRLKGPYNRRNVYGAALAYGPVLATDPRGRPMLDAVLRHGLCGERPLLAELGVDPGSVAGGVRLRYAPRPGTDLGSLPRMLEAPCTDHSAGSGRPPSPPSARGAPAQP